MLTPAGCSSVIGAAAVGTPPVLLTVTATAPPPPATSGSATVRSDTVRVAGASTRSAKLFLIERCAASVAVSGSGPAGWFGEIVTVSASVSPCSSHSAEGWGFGVCTQLRVTRSVPVAKVIGPGTSTRSARVALMFTVCGLPSASSESAEAVSRVIPGSTGSGTDRVSRIVSPSDRLTVATGCGSDGTDGCTKTVKPSCRVAPLATGGRAQFATAAVGSATARAAAAAGGAQLPAAIVTPVSVRPSGSCTSIDSPPSDAMPPVFATVTVNVPVPPSTGRSVIVGSRRSSCAGATTCSGCPSAVSGTSRPPSSVAVTGRSPLGVPRGTVMLTSKVESPQVRVLPSALDGQPAGPVRVTPPVAVRVTGPGLSTVLSTRSTVMVRVAGLPSATSGSAGVAVRPRIPDWTGLVIGAVVTPPTDSCSVTWAGVSGPTVRSTLRASESWLGIGLRVQPWSVQLPELSPARRTPCGGSTSETSSGAVGASSELLTVTASVPPPPATSGVETDSSDSVGAGAARTCSAPKLSLIVRPAASVAVNGSGPGGWPGETVTVSCSMVPSSSQFVEAAGCGWSPQLTVTSLVPVLNVIGPGSVTVGARVAVIVSSCGTPLATSVVAGTLSPVMPASTGTAMLRPPARPARVTSA